MNTSLPFRVRHDQGSPEIEWFVYDGQPIRDPFFDLTARRHARRHRTPLAALRDIGPGVAPAAFIFHVSRCGSTLATQMLAALDANRVLSEPPIVDDVLRLHRRDPAVTEDDQVALLRGAVHALGAPTPGVERMFIKLDCWHLFSLPLVARAFPQVPRLFLFRDPIEVLVSLQRRPSVTLLPDTITDDQLRLTARERTSLSPSERAAAIIGALFRSAWEQRAELTPIHYRQLPDFILNSIPGSAFTAREQALARAAATHNAKDPSVAFVPDSDDKRQAAGPALRAAAARWVEPHYANWMAAAGSPRPANEAGGRAHAAGAADPAAAAAGFT